jgi:hypothetical protein
MISLWRGLPLMAAVMPLLLAACQLERQHDHVYTAFGQDVGIVNYREISAHDSKVSFTGDDPAKRREAMALYDRYRERIVFKNNATLAYGRVYRGGFRDDGTTMLEYAFDQKLLKENGILFDRAKVKRTGYFAYIVQSSASFRCFIAQGVFGIPDPDVRADSPGDQEISASLCHPAAAESEEALEHEMLELLGRARFDDGAGNRIRYAATSPTP